MKIKNNYMLRKVSDSYVVVPVGEEVANFNGMINLNEAGALLWRCLEQDTNEASLVSVLTEHYEVDEDTAKRDTRDFINQLRECKILIESH